MEKEILTISSFAQQEVILKKSRFIGLAWPIGTEEEAVELLEKSKIDFPAATHYVFAYVLGPKGEIARFSDDGEPGGTAGKPVLSAIRLQNLTNTLVIVIRYFGGILLGAPGLVRAYSQAAREALAAAGTKRLELSVKGRVTLTYQLLDTILYQLEKLGARIENTEYGAEVTVSFFLSQAKLAAAESFLAGHMLTIEVEEDQLYL